MQRVGPVPTGRISVEHSLRANVVNPPLCGTPRALAMGVDQYLRAPSSAPHPTTSFVPRSVPSDHRFGYARIDRMPRNGPASSDQVAQRQDASSSVFSPGVTCSWSSARMVSRPVPAASNHAWWGHPARKPGATVPLNRLTRQTLSKPLHRHRRTLPLQDTVSCGRTLSDVPS